MRTGRSRNRCQSLQEQRMGSYRANCPPGRLDGRIREVLSSGEQKPGTLPPRFFQTQYEWTLTRRLCMHERDRTANRAAYPLEMYASLEIGETCNSRRQVHIQTFVFEGQAHTHKAMYCCMFGHALAARGTKRWRYWVAG